MISSTCSPFGLNHRLAQSFNFCTNTLGLTPSVYLTALNFSLYLSANKPTRSNIGLLVTQCKWLVLLSPDKGLAIILHPHPHKQQFSQKSIEMCQDQPRGPFYRAPALLTSIPPRQDLSHFVLTAAPRVLLHEFLKHQLLLHLSQQNLLLGLLVLLECQKCPLHLLLLLYQPPHQLLSLLQLGLPHAVSQAFLAPRQAPTCEQASTSSPGKPWLRSPLGELSSTQIHQGNFTTCAY